ncbi:MAG: hypothetical protein M0P17_06045 [Methanoculleus sp.]|nr:hypothetical protein [Methanoculleus sp.]
MNFRLLPALIVLLVAFSLCAACTGSDEPTGPSQTQTPAVTATPASTTSVSLTPGPTQTAPPGKEVEFQITENYPSRVTSDLTITFVGGSGQSYLTSIDVRVTKANGEVVTDSMEITRGEEFTVKNAKGNNRVEITVAYVTETAPFKVMDKIVKVP